MNDLTSIVAELRTIQDSDSAWHGPGLKKILSDVDAAIAAKRPYSDYRSIWELVLHISKWEEVFCLRLQGHTLKEPIEGDWPPVIDATEQAWKNAIQFLNDSHERLIDIVSKLNDSDLEQIVSGKDYTIRYMLHGIVRHHVYHAAQIALLKRA